MIRGRKPKIVSWDKQTEEHPFQRFPLEDGDSQFLILGSFPPNKFTIYTNKKNSFDVDFFYGSKDNSFWDLFISSKALPLKCLHFGKVSRLRQSVF